MGLGLILFLFFNMFIKKIFSLVLFLNCSNLFVIVRMSRRITPVPVSDSEFNAMKVPPCFKAPTFLVKSTSQAIKSIDLKDAEVCTGEKSVELVADNDDEVMVTRTPPNTPIMGPKEYRNALGLDDSSSEDLSDIDLDGDETEVVYPSTEMAWAPTLLLNEDGSEMEFSTPDRRRIQRLPAPVRPARPARKRKAVAQLSMNDVDVMEGDDVSVVDSVSNDRRPVIDLTRRSNEAASSESAWAFSLDNDVDVVAVPGQVHPAVEAVEERLGIPASGRGPCAKCWCLTWNNPSLSGDEWAEVLRSCPDIAMGCFQKEVGESGTPHFQGYIEMKKKGYHTAVRAAVGGFGMTVQNAKSGRKKNFAYCTKEDTRVAGPWFINCDASAGGRATQGKRTDLDAYAEAVVAEGGVTAKVFEDFPGHSVQFLKHGEAIVRHLNLLKAKQEERDHWQEMYQRHLAGEDMAKLGVKPREVEVLFGPTAVGKTTSVYFKVLGELQERLYEKPGNNKWWDGYDDEPNVVLDEFKGDLFGDIETVNNLLNQGVKVVETKGGSKLMNVKRIFLTTNAHPSHWWKKDGNSHYCWDHGHYRAFARRVARVKWWNDARELTVLENPGVDDGSEEWQAKNIAWVRFWKWRDRPVREGDNITEMENNYFTYF